MIRKVLQDTGTLRAGGNDAARRGWRHMGGMAWRMALMLVMVLGVFIFVAFIKYQQFQGFKVFAAAMKDPPQTVSAATATFQQWQAEQSGVGTLRAVNGVDLSFETAGIVDQLHFNSGDDVPAGAVLVSLRPDDQPGKVAALEAQVKLAEITQARDQKQFQAQAVAQATLDADTANLSNLKAQLAQAKAQLDEKTIRAPFAGHLGIRQVDLGQYVSAGTAVVTLQALDPIYVDFYLPQQALDQLKLREVATLKVDTYPDRIFKGEISAINPKVDQTNRNIQVRATIKNPDHKLLPGMYGTVLIQSGQPQSYLTLPQTAITFNPYGSTVFIVSNDPVPAGDDKAAKPEADKKEAKDDRKSRDATPAADAKNMPHAKQAFVTTGPTRGDQIAVLTGLKEGDQVVTSGQNKLHNGAPLIINNTVQPASDQNPMPQDH